MFDWRASSADPTRLESFRGLDAYLRGITRFPAQARLDFILDFCREQTVLDIGAGEHDPSFYSASGWEHGQIRKVATSAIAAEINPTLCDFYNANGFDFRCVDATSDADLGERFTRIFAGDVIEHVNDPVAMLRFIGRHLTTDGAALLTTPNPFARRFRHSRRRLGTYYVPANLEHTRWLSSSNMHEIAWRAGLRLSALSWPILRKRKSPMAKPLALLGRRVQVALLGPEAVYPEYAFELKHRTTGD